MVVILFMCNADDLLHPNYDTHHYSNIKWASRHLSSPASQLFVQQFVQTDIEGKTKAPHYPPFVTGIYLDRWIPLTKTYSKLFNIQGKFSSS